MATAIETFDLSKTYNGGVEALKSLDLEIKKGEAIGYIGPNGAGKTTTIQILLNLIRPTRGEAYILGEKLKGQEKKLLRNVGSLVEIPGFYEYLTPNDILSYICDLYRMSKDDAQASIDQVLEILRIDHVKHKKIETFSTGMKRRLGIGTALVHDPDLLILDEPTIGLDPKGIREIRDLVKKLNKAGKTIFLTSHNLTEVTEITERVLFLREGELVKDIQMDDLENQLRSKQISVKFIEQPSQEQKELIADLHHVEKVSYGKTTEISYNGGPEETNYILKNLIKQKLPVYSFAPHSMTLEDLYLDLYGREVLVEERAELR